MRVAAFVIENDGLEIRITRDTRKSLHDGFLLEDDQGYVRVNMEILKELVEAAKLLEQP